MAERRMFAKALIDSDLFLDLPLSAQSKEAIADDVARLIETKNYLLKQRARFVSFMATLDPIEIKVLKLRCEENNAWKGIAAELHISDTTAKRILTDVTEKAEEYGGFF